MRVTSALLVAAIALFGAALASAAPEPTPCCAPSQFEGVSAQWDPREQFHRNSLLSYDAPNQRIRVAWNQRVKEVSHRYVVIMLYQTKTLYFIDENHTGDKIFSCQKHDLMETFPMDCVPTDAKYDGQVTLGGALLTDVWTFHTEFRNQTIKGYEMRSRNGCWFVSGLNRSHRFGADFHLMWNLQSGIRDPSVFTPPTQCTSSGKTAQFESLQRVLAATRGDN